MRRHDEETVTDGSLGDGDHDESFTPRDLTMPKNCKIPVSAYVILAAAVRSASYRVRPETRRTRLRHVWP